MITMCGEKALKQTTTGRDVGRGRLLRLRPLSTVLVAALGIAGAVAAPSSADATSTASSTAAASLSAAGGASSRTVTLVTGDRVIATTGAGKTSYTIDPAVPGDAAFQSYQDAQGDYHVVPALAAPFLGTTLNPSLFDITAQLRAATNAATGGATSGARADAATGAVAEVSPQSSARLVAALRQAVGADVQAGRRPGTTVPKLTGLPAAPRSDSAQPAPDAAGYPQRILQVDVTDRSGKPANGTAFLINTDSSLKFLNQITINGGVDRVAVPAGHYSIAFNAQTFDAKGNVTSAYALTRTDFTVPATGTVPDVVLNGRSAVTFKVATPLATTSQLANVLWNRGEAAQPTTSAAVAVPDGGGGTMPDPSADLSYQALGNIPFGMNPQPAPKVGTLSVEAQWVGGQGSYRYDTVFPATDVPDLSALRVTAAQLATEHNHYYTDPASPKQGGVEDLPWDYANPQPMAGSVVVPQALPADVTEYLNVLPQFEWVQQVLEGDAIAFLGDPITPAAGSTTSIDWGRGPLAPGVGQHTLQPGAASAYSDDYCGACVAGANLSMSFSDFDDSTPGQQGNPNYAGGAPLAVNSSLSVYQNGQLLGTTPDSRTVSISDAPAAGAKYQVTYTTGTATPQMSQSTSSDTTLTFSSTPAAEAGAALTPLGICIGQSQATPCLVLPVLNLTTQLAVDEENTAAPGAETMGLSVGHVSYNGTGSHAAITAATVQVSFDGGKTWQTAQLSHTGAATSGDYTAAWTNPAADTGVRPSIRITATDALGGSIDQTVSNAYEIVKGA